MFTGLIEAMGVVAQIATVGDSQLKLTIESDLIVEDTRIGDSVAVNGCCLTVIEIDNHVFSVEVVNETILRTNLSLLQPEDKVNLERSLKVGDRLGGHFVQGHIDGMGEVLQPPPNLVIRLQPNLIPLVALKGSIAINGVSLTVAGIDQDDVSIAIIPHTLANTNLSALERTSTVNVEVDIIARYIDSLLNKERAGEIAT